VASALLAASPVALEREALVESRGLVESVSTVQVSTEKLSAEQLSVLVVYSYDSGLGWTRSLARGLAKALSAEPGVRIYSEHLDAKQWPSLEHAGAFLEMLSEKFDPRPPDVLVISDDPAFELLTSQDEPLFPGVPIVFMGLNRVREELQGGVPGITGMFETHETEKTADFAIELTGAEGLVVINDTSETGVANEKTISRLREKYSDLNWVVYRDLVIDDLDVLRRYPAHSPVLPMLPLREGHAKGAMLTQYESISALRRRLPNPLFYDVDWLMGSGIVGGYIHSGEEHARQAGEFVLKILRGTPAEEIPARLEAEHHWAFDYRELVRFGWEDSVPPDSEFLFKEESYLERNREFLVPTLIGSLIALLVIAGLGMTIARQRSAERRLRRQERRLLTALSASHAGVFEIGPGESRYASSRWLELLGCPGATQSEISTWFVGNSADSREVFFDAVARLRAGSRHERVELQVGARDRKRLDVLMTVSRGKVEGETTIVGVGRDITATRQLEEANSQRARLNALGELAGGIAHDFNNILTVININSEVIRELDDLEEIRALSAEVETAGSRATELVRQLLAFGRQDTDRSGGLDLNQPVRGLHQFLHRLLGEQHELVTFPADEEVGVMLQPAQADQIIANFVLNARDAMPDGGTILVETRIEKGSDGEWAVLSVTDEGTGMDEETRDRAFEPFFTTKPLGQGTGLGLSTVYGIVSATGGEIQVESELGRGTCFEIRWRRVALEGRSEARAPSGRAATDGHQILVVEDEPSIGRLICHVLGQVGHHVELALDGAEGLDLFSSRPRDFDLILTDVVLPRMSGLEMAAEIRKIDSSARIGYMSGYTRHPTVAGQELPPGAKLLGKPFSKTELLNYVSEQLGTRELRSERDFPRGLGAPGVRPSGPDRVH